MPRSYVCSVLADATANYSPTPKSCYRCLGCSDSVSLLYSEVNKRKFYCSMTGDRLIVFDLAIDEF